MISKLNKPSVIYSIAIALLWLNFSAHILSTLPLKKYLDGEFPSESFVFSRLVYNLDHGTDANGGFMVKYNHVGGLYKSVDRQDYADFKQSLIDEQDKTHPYLSHYGLQDDLVFPIWQGLEWVKGEILKKARPNSRWHKRLQTLDLYYYNLISQTLVALINALVIAVFIYWAASQFAPLCAWLSLAGVLTLMPVLGFYGRSLWWMEWSWFLPCAITLIGLKIGEKWGDVPSLMRSCVISIFVGAAVCVKVMMGYEFVPCVMMGALIPIAFYGVYRNWGLKPWLVSSIIIGLGALAGLMIAMLQHYQALQAYGVDPFDLMRSRYEMRASGGDSVTKVGEIYESTQASFLSVLLGYLLSPKELAIPQILFMFPFLIWLARYVRSARALMQQHSRRLCDAFVTVIALGMFGGGAMLFILKGHAYIHGYDIVIWAIPTNIFLLIFYALRIIGLDNVNKPLLEDKA